MIRHICQDGRLEVRRGRHCGQHGRLEWNEEIPEKRSSGWKGMIRARQTVSTAGWCEDWMTRQNGEHGRLEMSKAWPP